MVLTPAEIAAMQAVMEAHMPDTAAITRRLGTKNSIGGREAEPTAVVGLESVPCHVHPDTTGGSREQRLQDKTSVIDRYRIMFPVGYDIRATDIATISGVEYEIVSVDSSRSWDIELEAQAVRRQ